MALKSDLQLKAEAFLHNAHSALKQSSVYAAFPKNEEAVYNFRRAANTFAIASMWEEAGHAHLEAAEAEVTIHRKLEAAMEYLEAGKYLRRISTDDAIQVELKGVKILCDLGLFERAAHVYLTIAEVYEDDSQMEPAIEYYQHAGDFYISQKMYGQAELALDKVGKLCGQLGHYVRASQIFRQLGKSCLMDNLRRFNSKIYFLNAGLMLLCNDDSEGAHALRRQNRRQDFLYFQSAEHDFLRDATDCLEDLDLDKYVDHAFNYDNVTKCDSWTLLILGRLAENIKTHIEMEKEALLAAEQPSDSEDSDEMFGDSDDD